LLQVVWVYLHSNLCTGLQKRIFAATECWPKTGFESNSRSRSFKVIYFATNYRPTRSSISPRNIAGLIFEVSEELAVQMAKNCRRRALHSHLTPRQEEPPRISPQTLHFQKIGSLGYIFVAGCMGLSLFKFVHWALKDASFLRKSAFLPFKVIQGRPRSVILVPIESAHTTSYL